MRTDDKVLRWMKRFGHAPFITLDQARRGGVGLRVDDQLVETAIVPEPTKRFCGCPDFIDYEIIQSTPLQVSDALRITQPEAADLIGMYASMAVPIAQRFDVPILGQQAFEGVAGTGTGSFPRGCNGAHTPRHSFTWHTNHAQWARYSHWVRRCTDRELQGIVDAGVWGLDFEYVQRRWGQTPMYRVAIALATESYRRQSILPIEVPWGTPAMSQLTCIHIPGGTIGLGWFNNGTCLARIPGAFEARQDAGWTPDLDGATNLITHEWGHVNRRQHDFNGQSGPNGHHGVMSYDPRKPFQGFREGPQGHPVTADWKTTIRRDPAAIGFNGFYGMVPFLEDWAHAA
jgi:hypothetical protein